MKRPHWIIRSSRMGLILLTNRAFFSHPNGPVWSSETAECCCSSAQISLQMGPMRAQFRPNSGHKRTPNLPNFGLISATNGAQHCPVSAQIRPRTDPKTAHFGPKMAYKQWAQKLQGGTPQIMPGPARGACQESRHLLGIRNPICCAGCDI